MDAQTQKIDILSLSLEELTEEIVKIGLPKFRAKQIFSWINKGSFGSEMTNISKDLQKRGMTFVGSVIIYSYLQAIGIIVSHDEECDLYKG